MPSLKSIFLTIILTVVVFFAISYILGSLPEVQQFLTEKAQQLLELVKPIQTKWQSLPPLAQQLIPMGILFGFTCFFAWASSLWRKKCQETEQQATIKQTQLSGEVELATAQSKDLRDQLTATQKDLDLYKEFYDKSSLLDNKIASVQQANKQEISSMESTLRSDYSSLSRELQNLRKLIDENKKIP